MIIDDPARLKVRIDRDRAHIAKASLLEILTDTRRKRIAHGNSSPFMACITQHLPIGIFPEILAKGAELLANPSEALRIMNDGTNLAPGTNHALRMEQALNVLFSIVCNL